MNVLRLFKPTRTTIIVFAIFFIIGAVAVTFGGRAVGCIDCNGTPYPTMNKVMRVLFLPRTLINPTSMNEEKMGLALSVLTWYIMSCLIGAGIEMITKKKVVSHRESASPKP